MCFRVYTCAHTCLYEQSAARVHAYEGAQLVRAAAKMKEYMKEMLIAALLTSQS